MTPTFEQRKLELMEKFESSKSYQGGHIKTVIHGTSFKDCLVKEHIPTQVKKGDVLVFQEGVKRRPCVVLKVCKDGTVIYTALTSQENAHSLIESKSRFFTSGFFCKFISVCSHEQALENWVGVYDNAKLVNQAIRELKNYFNSNL